MIYFCADDYGISKISNNRIEECLNKGVLNKISVLPNGDIADFKERLLDKNVKLSLHLNLIEGRPLSNKDEISLLVTKEGFFRYSFIGLFFLSLFGKRKSLGDQIYKEIKKQIDFWKKNVGEGEPLLIDSHQHTHMIPLILKTLIKVINDEGVNVEYIRIPAEPIMPYIKTPSLYLAYGFSGIIKHWLLNILKIINHKELKKANLNSAAFMGILFSGKLTQEKIAKLLPHYQKLGKNIELTFHPGYLEPDETIMEGGQTGFKKFYYSKWRKKEYETLLNFRY